MVANICYTPYILYGASTFLKMKTRIKSVQTGKSFGTFKFGDLHPIYKNRFFYQYVNKIKEIWLTKKTFEKYKEQSRKRSRERMAFLRKNHPELVKKYKSKATPQSKQRRRNKIKLQRKDPILGDAIRKKNMHYYYNNPTHKIACCLRSRLKEALKKFKKSKSTEKLVGCSFENLKKYLELKFTEGMNWKNHGKWHIDHIVPCSSFDLSKEEEQRACFHFSNLQPLWAKDNLVKGCKKSYL
jgi:hypothetical protein